MSMLAEPRRKQKVINLRAKNNAWSNDSNKFGQRMLEKMGWSSGKGLGVKENGIVEHVVARYKNDEKGLGYEDRNDQWTKHEDDFNSLLANLSNDDTGVTQPLCSGVSLEKKSKKSKTRIHYHKFTRGKDLSRYSEKDLANIFGKKSFKETKAEESTKEDVIITEQVFTEKGNMNDYFKDKLAAFKSKLCSTNIKEDNIADYGFQGFSTSTEQESEKINNISEPISIYRSEKVEIIEQNESIPGPQIEVTETKKKEKTSKVNKLSKAEVNVHTSTECPQVTNQYENVIKSKKEKKSKNKKHKKCMEDQMQTKDEIIERRKKEKNCVDSVEKNVLIVEENIPKKKKKRKNYDF